MRICTRSLLQRGLGAFVALAALSLALGAGLAPARLSAILPVAQGVGMNTALAATLYGLLLLTSKTHADPGARLLNGALALLALAALAQHSAGLYPPEGPWRLVLNTQVLPGTWSGRMSPTTAMIVLCFASGGLLLARPGARTLAAAHLLHALGSLTALAYFTAHVANVTLPHWHFPSSGFLSPITAFLFTLGGLSGWLLLGNEPHVVAWRFERPGRELFVKATAAFSTLLVVGSLFAGSLLTKNGGNLALALILFLAMVGAAFLHRHIVPELEHSEEARAALRTAARQQELILAHVQQGIYGLDNAGRVIFANEATESLLGYPAATLIGKDMHALIHHSRGDGSAYSREDCPVHKAMLDGQVRREEGDVFWHADGRAIEVAYSVAALKEGNETAGAVVVFREIGEERRRLRDMKRWQDVFEYAEWGVVIGGPDNHTLHLLNPAFARMHGYSVEELTGRPISDLFPPDEMPVLRAMMQKAHQEGHVRFASRHRRKDGHVFPVLIDVTAVKDGQGQILHRVVNVLDIAEQKAAEEKLRRSEAALREAQAQARLGSWQLDMSTNSLEWSDECYRIFGLPVGARITYEDFLARVHPEDRVQVESAWNAAISGASYDIEHRILVDGQVRWIREMAQLEFRRESGLWRGMGTAQDITELKEKEEDLLRSRRMLRELAAHHEQIREEERSRIAREIHDVLGQYLTALRMDTAMLPMRFGTTEGLAEHAGKMKQTIDTTIGVVRNLTAALRPGALDAGLTSAAEWLLAEFEERSGILCHLEAPREDHLGLSDTQATAAFRILQESLTNVARHAEAREVIVTLSRSRDALTMRIQDDGKGFDPRTIRSKTFGLLGMRERAMAFGGETHIESRPGEGTTVYVLIPFSPDHPLGDAFPFSDSHPPPPSGRANMIRVMIADDHSIVRQGLRQLLELDQDMSLCREAKNGWDVLEGVKAGDCDLLLTDLTMPGPNGIELIKRVHEEAPTLPILVLSMHGESQIASRAVKAGAAGYLTKDSDPEALLTAIRKVASGGHYISQEVASEMVFAASQPEGIEEPHERLSEREYQVFMMLVRGKSLNEIADELHLSPKTVSTHKFRFMNKLGFTSVSELVRYALKHGLIEP